MRLARHGANALRVAEWLEAHPGVTRVAYPGLASFPQAELARRQQRSGGGMLTFEVEGGTESALELMRLLRFCSLAENLGAVETLVTHSASMTHAALTSNERDALGIHDGLIRVSVGLEDPADIIADLEQALEQALSARRKAPAPGPVAVSARPAAEANAAAFARVEAVTAVARRGGGR